MQLNFACDRFYHYDELTQLLQDCADAYPQLLRLESLGKSHEGREIWLLRITDYSSGDDTEKPALWIDGNIHATELAASSACLRFLQVLLQGFEQGDPVIQRCLQRCTIYLCPRQNPDGAELALAEQPQFVRSSTRPYPLRDRDSSGLQEADIDGDGRILLMRIPDPHGAWKVHPQESRLLVRRDPVESGGQYYRVLPEGLIQDYDGDLIPLQPRQQGLDLNRNYPIDWRPEHEQLGAGPFPASEPEVQAVVKFLSDRTNLFAAISFHTFSGVLLRPYSHKPDETFPVADLRTYEVIGKAGEEQTGYPAIGVYHHFRYDPKEITTGVFDDWAYDHLGLFAWTVEIWSPQKAAGIEKYDWIDWFREHPVEDDLKFLDWNDRELEGKGFIDWYPFEHPQLGLVELGGWDDLHTWRNPPQKFLQAELDRFPQWLLWQLQIAPQLEVISAEVQALGARLYKVKLVLQNSGWLPTYISQKALERHLVDPLVAELQLPEGVELCQGKARQELGQMEGRAQKGVMPEADPTSDRAKAEWIVRGDRGQVITLEARHPRAGKLQRSLTLP
ncbi:M14 family metallopeptidase [Synechococcus elongatus IITB4]|uniref:M14 family metallopeptidase n=1 Tax=Synechococcus elongatus TaxID=32046 RepID=UPI0030CA9B35